jgi:hypothetical protein
MQNTGKAIRRVGRLAWLPNIALAAFCIDFGGPLVCCGEQMELISL